MIRNICITPRACTRVFAVVVCLIFIGNAAAQQQSSPSKLQQALVEILERQAEAWNEGNLEQFMDAYWKSEELTFCSGGNITRGWQATLDRYRQNYNDKEAMGHLTFADLEVSSLGADAALMLGRWKVTAKGQDYGGNFSLVWRKIDGHWKIIHDHTSSSESTEPAPADADK